jgi:hypothetical protein
MVTGSAGSGDTAPVARSGREALAAGHGQRVEDVARAVIAMVAPDELAYFDGLSAQFFASPARAVYPARPHDKLGGSNLPGVMELVTSIVVGGLSGALSDEIKAVIAVAIRPGPSLARWRARRKLRAAGPEMLRQRVRPDQAARAVDEVKTFAIKVELPAELVRQLAVALAAVLLASGEAGRDGRAGRDGGAGRDGDGETGKADGGRSPAEEGAGDAGSPPLA